MISPEVPGRANTQIGEKLDDWERPLKLKDQDATSRGGPRQTSMPPAQGRRDRLDGFGANVVLKINCYCD